MNELIQTFQSLTPSLQLFWGCAIVTSVIFLVQAVLTMIGTDMMDTDLDLDFSADADGDTMDVGGGLSLFSFRNIVNFFLGFGWAGVCLHGVITSKVLLYLAAVVVGCIFVWIFFVLKRQTKKLESDGTVRLSMAVGKQADVYLRIPAACSAKGKIQISINGSIREYDAVTDGDAIPTGQKVVVRELVDDYTVKVATI